MHDNYAHIDSRVIYVKECIPGPFEVNKEYLDILEDFNSQLSQHCNCKEKISCIDVNCCCVESAGGSNYFVCMKPEMNFTLSEKKFDQCFIVECNNLCECPRNCGNRVVQRGPIDGLEVKETGGKGLGLFTTKFIPKGTFVCEYAGEIITKATALKRQEIDYVRNQMNYIYCLNEHSSGKVIQTFIDPTYIGNIGRYVNHSCEPNCQIIPVRVDIPIPKLAIFTMSDVCEGEELTFHYGLNMSSEAKDSESSFRKKCLCNSPNCSYFMPYNDYGST